MPQRPPSVCAQPGCPELTHGTRCAQHQAELYRRDRQQRGSTTERGLGWDHQRLAQQVLAGTTTCGICGDPPRPGDPLEADHVTPRSQGGRNVRSNYRAAHASCNRGRKVDGQQQLPDGRDDPPSPPVFA